jgi:hypothetical protein
MAHAVTMFQITLKRDSDNLHIVVRVGTKTFTSFHMIIIHDPQHTEVHPVTIVIIGKTEGMVRFEPAVIGMPTAVGRMIHCIHFLYFFFLMFNNYLKMVH